MTESIVMTEFLQACLRAQACPLCAIVDRIESQCLGGYVDISGASDEPRLRLAQTECFCRRHASQLRYYLWSDRQSDVALARAYESLTARIEARLQEIVDEQRRPAGLRGLFGRRPAPVSESIGEALPRLHSCPVCKTVEAMEISALWAVAEHVTGEPDDALDALSRSCGLCLPHFCGLTREVQDERLTRRLCETELALVSSLRDRLSDYVDKHGYCFQDDEFAVWERSCWTEAINFMVGSSV